MKELEKEKQKGERLALRLANGNRPTSPFRQFADCLWIFNLQISTECEEFISVLNTEDISVTL